ncbi:MAG: ATP-dependent DNA helicase RecG [Candidatus Binatia bacterium]
MPENTQLQIPAPPRHKARLTGGGSTALDAFLAAVSAPLSFLAAAAAAAPRTRVPARALAHRGRVLLQRLSNSRQRSDLQALCDELIALDAALPVQRHAHVERCRVLVDRIRRGSPEDVPPYRSSSSPAAEDLQALAQPVQFVPGVGPRLAEQLKKFGIGTVEDLLYHLPFRYEDRRTLSKIRQLRAGEVASVVGEITHLAERHVGRAQRRILEGVLRDDTGLLALTWYHQVTYFRQRYQVGQRCLVHGKVEGDAAGQKRMVHPEVDLSADPEGQGILPVYNKPTTVHVGVMRRLVQRAVAEWGPRLPSVLPQRVVRAAGVTDLQQAMRRIHQPQRDADIERLNALRSIGHRSLVFDELFFLQLGMALRRRAVAVESGLALPLRGTLTQRLRALLPFRLTRAQQRVLQEIYADMAQPHPLHRLVQGDVGSGKTIVALFAALVAIENGYQAAFMAPTELLAEQHSATIRDATTALGLETVLLTSELTRAQRRDVHQRIRSGDVQLAVGTHALIQEGVTFKALGLGVIDEQHRFGVLQRAALRRLGAPGEVAPDILLMTATPIPRTLAMAVYGDLDISTLDELPPGRQPVRTLLRHEGERPAVYDLVKRQLDQGRQGYVVYPLVDDSDALALRAATTMAQELARTVFDGYRVGLVHGRMKGAEKDAVMRRFKAGDVQLLVSTTVIEVGIDVPNATVMVVEHAERFGLAQLHQLRGRVGRGTDAALCILLTPFHRGAEARRRLQALAATQDGFKVAEVDLELRGPGELLGTRQSGLPDFRVANLIRDRRLLDEARAAADAWLRADPRLERPESRALRAVLVHRWAGRLELAEIG